MGERLPKAHSLDIFLQNFTLNNNGELIVTNGGDDSTAFEMGSVCVCV